MVRSTSTPVISQLLLLSQIAGAQKQKNKVRRSYKKPVAVPLNAFLSDNCLLREYKLKGEQSPGF